jgi:hypothetical protein
MSGTRRPLPVQLPHQIPDFTGRHAEIDRLDALVTGPHESIGTSVVITSIAGTAGVGKTASIEPGFPGAAVLRARHPVDDQRVTARSIRLISRCCTGSQLVSGDRSLVSMRRA